MNPIRILFFLLGALVSLAGCKNEAPRTPAGDAPHATIDAAKPSGAAVEASGHPGETADSAPPASHADAGRVIDLRTFPLFENGEILERTLAKASYRVNGDDPAQGVAFYRKELVAAGWKLAAEENDETRRYHAMHWTRDGFMLDMIVMYHPHEKGVMVFATNAGNVDTRLLPRHGGAMPTLAGFGRTTFTAEAPLDEVAKATREELTKLGWLITSVPGADPQREQGVRDIARTIQRGMALDATFEAKDGMTEVAYHARLLSEELPIADAAGAVEFLETPLQLFYATKKDPVETLDFHRTELAKLGWTPRPGTDSISPEGKALVIFDAPEKTPLRLELLVRDKDYTIVLLASAPK